MARTRMSAKQFAMKQIARVISRTEEEIFTDGMERRGRPLLTAAEVASRVMDKIIRRVKMEFLAELIEEAAGKPMIARTFLVNRLTEMNYDD